MRCIDVMPIMTMHPATDALRKAESAEHQNAEAAFLASMRSSLFLGNECQSPNAQPEQSFTDDAFPKIEWSYNMEETVFSNVKKEKISAGLRLVLTNELGLSKSKGRHKKLTRAKAFRSSLTSLKKPWPSARLTSASFKECSQPKIRQGSGHLLVRSKAFKSSLVTLSPVSVAFSKATSRVMPEAEYGYFHF